MIRGFKIYIVFIAIILFGTKFISAQRNVDSVDVELKINKVMLDEVNDLLNVFVSVPGIKGAEFNANTINLYEMVNGKRCQLFFHSYDKLSEVEGTITSDDPVPVL